MFDLIFGALVLGFSLFCLMVALSSGGISNIIGLLFACIFSGIFIIAGLLIFVRGLKKVVANYKTSKNGEECYALLTDILPTGSRVNGMPELKGNFLVYILSLNKTVSVEEVIGFNPFKYKVNDYVKAKFYNGDINILDVIQSDMVPSNVKRQLGGLTKDISSENSEDIIHIDGHTYKRID